MRARKRGARGISAVPPFHPDYEPAHDWQDDDDDDDGGGGEHFAEYEYERGWGGTGHGHGHVRRGSEGYEVRAIDREQLLGEHIASRGQEEGHYRRYVPEPPSESESGAEDGDGAGQVEVYAEGDDEDDDDEMLAVRVERWRSGEAIS